MGHGRSFLNSFQAAAKAPSIIFLDELDGLVPSRAQQEGGSDQIYASVVSTVLALMDGIADRGSVIVLGATNRYLDFRSDNRFAHDRHMLHPLQLIYQTGVFGSLQIRLFHSRESPLKCLMRLLSNFIFV